MRVFHMKGVRARAWQKGARVGVRVEEGLEVVDRDEGIVNEVGDGGVGVKLRIIWRNER